MLRPDPKSYPLRGNNNQLLTTSLFYEPWSNQNEQFRAEGITPVFTLTTDRDGLIPVRDTLLEERDPTGAKWAIKYLEGVHHLNRLLTTDWFREPYEVFIAELETILQSENLERIGKIAAGSSPAAFQAAKYMASKEWKKLSKGRGRPSKAEVQGELKKEVERQSAEHSDAERIGLRVVK